MATIRMRRDYAANWTSRNPVLSSGEPGFEIDTRTVKIGDGVHRWLDLEYLTFSGSDDELLAHIESLTPHPVYDDGPSLVLLYENAKV